MGSNELNGRQPPAAKETRMSKSEEETKVDIPAVSVGANAGNGSGFPCIRILVSRPGAAPLDVTARVMPPVALKIVEIIFHINGDTADLEKIDLILRMARTETFPRQLLGL